MCNQTEMWKEIDEYDRRASRGEVHVRGVAHDPETCLKCRRDRAGAKKVRVTKASRELERRLKLWIKECLPGNSAKMKAARKEAFIKCMKIIDDAFAKAPKAKRSGRGRCPTCRDVKTVRGENIGNCPDPWHEA